MTRGSAHDAHRCHSWRIGRLVCGVTAAIGLMVALTSVTSAQPPNPPNNQALRRVAG